MSRTAEWLTVVHGERRYEARLVRSRRRTIGLRISAEGALEVRAPLRIGLAELEAGVRQKSAWIDRHLRRIEANPPPPPPRWITGETHPWLGEPHVLQVQAAPRRALRIADGRIELQLPPPGRPAEVEAAFRHGAVTAARQVFEARLPPWIGRAAALGIPAPERLTVRWMRSRWGSCGRGRVTLNAALAQQSPACIDYVLVHELCHLREANHGPRFWALVETLMPDWKRQRATLRKAPAGAPAGKP